MVSVTGQEGVTDDDGRESKNVGQQLREQKRPEIIKDE